jgi:predicted metalloprotease
VKWNRGAGTGNVEDRRGMGGMGVPAIGGGAGVIGIIFFLLVNVLGGGGGGGGGGIQLPNLSPVSPSATGGTIPANDEAAQFAAFVLDDVQTSWKEAFAGSKETYRETHMVVFDQSTQTGCGVGQTAMGPFYCPSDETVYLDLTFFNELHDRFGAGGDFAQAYVIAHEVGHHVQTVLGISDQVQSREDGIKLELQADCFAGVWGHAAQAEGILESGDLEEGLRAANAIGDDTLQEQATGRVNPDTFTHGTSEQRVHWFKTGFDSGNPDRCDTFG